MAASTGPRAHSSDGCPTPTAHRVLQDSVPIDQQSLFYLFSYLYSSVSKTKTKEKRRFFKVYFKSGVVTRLLPEPIERFKF